MKKNKNFLKVKPVLLLDRNPLFIREDGRGFESLRDRNEMNYRIDKIFKKLDLDMEPPLYIWNEEDLNDLDTSFDIYLIFSFSIKRYAGLINLASLKKSIIITGEEGNINSVLDTYQYLSEFPNVSFTLNYEETRERVSVMNETKPLIDRKICLFDRGNRPLKEVTWYKNPLFRGVFNVERVNIGELRNIYQNIDRKDSRAIAEKWINEAEMQKCTSLDIEKSARIYLSMKKIIEDSNADASYVLWCGQFTSLFGTKMCFAIAKLNDDGILTGCWRGGNLMPMLILKEISGKPIFAGEAHIYGDGILSLRHCAVSSRLGDGNYILKNWREREGTVTGYCDLKEGKVTLVNAGQGDKVVILEGKVIRSEDIGGENCRVTVWIELENEDIVEHFTGVEFAMVYGDYKKQAKDYLDKLEIESVSD